jgi:hypothetical protein
VLKQVTGDTHANVQVTVKRTRRVTTNYQAHKKPWARIWGDYPTRRTRMKKEQLDDRDTDSK